jgi:heme/copper-type cytochrome/quinol oxidase subunit 1
LQFSCSYYPFSDFTLDLHFHDTYYVISFGWLKKWVGVWLLPAFVMYKLTRWKQGMVHTWIVIIQVVSVAFLLAVFQVPEKWMGMPHRPERYFDYSGSINDFTVLAALFALVCIGQVTFLFYFVIQLVKPRIPAPQRGIQNPLFITFAGHKTGS